MARASPRQLFRIGIARSKDCRLRPRGFTPRLSVSSITHQNLEVCVSARGLEKAAGRIPAESQVSSCKV